MPRPRHADGWLVPALCAALAAGPHAALAEHDLAGPGSGADALPGVDTVPLLAPARAAIAANATLGYGYTEAVLDADDSHHRIASRLGASYAILPWLSLAARLDGRFDTHAGGAGDDDGFVVQSQLAARAVQPLSPDLRLGADAAVRFPGGSHPGRGLAAAGAELRALLGLTVPEARLLLGSLLGLRIDRGRYGVADPDRLSLHDRVALGASDSNAVLLGLAFEHRFGPLALIGEWTWDVQVGADAPPAHESPMRLSAGARLFPSETMHVQLLAGASPSGRPPLEAQGPLYLIEPRLWITSAIGLYFDVGDRPREKRTPTAVPAPPPPSPGAVTGLTLDAAARSPLPGVSIEIPGRAPITSDTQGRFALDALPPGVYELRATAPGFRAATARVEVTAGATAEAAITLERELPEGQIRGTVRSFDGKPVAARIRVEPLGAVVQAGADGNFELDVAPGEYTVVISAPGYRKQQRPALVEHHGVTVIVVELSAAR